MEKRHNSPFGCLAIKLISFKNLVRLPPGESNPLCNDNLTYDILSFLGGFRASWREMTHRCGLILSLERDSNPHLRTWPACNPDLAIPAVIPLYHQGYLSLSLSEASARPRVPALEVRASGIELHSAIAAHPPDGVTRRCPAIETQDQKTGKPSSCKIVTIRTSTHCLP